MQAIKPFICRMQVGSHFLALEWSLNPERSKHCVAYLFVSLTMLRKVVNSRLNYETDGESGGSMRRGPGISWNVTGRSGKYTSESFLPKCPHLVHFQE